MRPRPVLATIERTRRRGRGHVPLPLLVIANATIGEPEHSWRASHSPILSGVLPSDRALKHFFAAAVSSTDEECYSHCARESVGEDGRGEETRTPGEDEPGCASGSPNGSGPSQPVGPQSGGGDDETQWDS